MKPPIDKRLQRVESLRATIRTLQAERERLQQQRRSRQQVVDTVRAMVSGWERKGRAHMARHLAMAAAAEPSAPLTMHGVGVVKTSPGPVEVVIDPAPLLVAMLGTEAVEAALLATIDSVPEGLTPELKRDRLAQIAASLDAAEIEEERLVEQSEADGMPIGRRPDARAEIVLGEPS